MKEALREGVVWLISVLTISIAPVAAQQPKLPSAAEYPIPLVREEQQVVVNGATETWRLQWAASPKPYCEPSDVSLTCPCIGFAYGEAGDLSLVRLRRGKEVERLRLSQLFVEEGSEAVAQRWRADYEKDFDLSSRSDFPGLVSKRPVANIMQLSDYDHDGAATEFYIQTEALACGHQDGVVVGVSKENPHIHVFGTASDPRKALHLEPHEWKALRDASGPVDVLAWACLDHGAETETILTLRWTEAGIAGIRREYNCPERGEQRKVLKESPLGADD